MGPPLRARNETVASGDSRLSRTGHGRENQRAHSDGRRKTTTLDDGRATIARRRQKHRTAAPRVRRIRSRRGRVRRRPAGRGRLSRLRFRVSSARALCPRRPRARQTYGYHHHIERYRNQRGSRGYRGRYGRKKTPLQNRFLISPYSVIDWRDGRQALRHCTRSVVLRRLVLPIYLHT